MQDLAQEKDDARGVNAEEKGVSSCACCWRRRSLTKVGVGRDCKREDQSRHRENAGSAEGTNQG